LNNSSSFSGKNDFLLFSNLNRLALFFSDDMPLSSQFASSTFHKYQSVTFPSEYSKEFSLESFKVPSSNSTVNRYSLIHDFSSFDDESLEKIVSFSSNVYYSFISNMLSSVISSLFSLLNSFTASFSFSKPCCTASLSSSSPSPEISKLNDPVSLDIPFSHKFSLYRSKYYENNLIYYSDQIFDLIDGENGVVMVNENTDYSHFIQPIWTYGDIVESISLSSGSSKEKSLLYSVFSLDSNLESSTNPFIKIFEIDLNNIPYYSNLFVLISLFVHNPPVYYSSLSSSSSSIIPVVFFLNNIYSFFVTGIDAEDKNGLNSPHSFISFPSLPSSPSVAHTHIYNNIKVYSLSNTNDSFFPSCFYITALIIKLRIWDSIWNYLDLLYSIMSKNITTSNQTSKKDTNSLKPLNHNFQLSLSLQSRLSLYQSFSYKPLPAFNVNGTLLNHNSESKPNLKSRTVTPKGIRHIDSFSSTSSNSPNIISSSSSNSNFPSLFYSSICLCFTNEDYFDLPLSTFSSHFVLFILNFSRLFVTQVLKILLSLLSHQNSPYISSSSLTSFYNFFQNVERRLSGTSNKVDTSSPSQTISSYFFSYLSIFLVGLSNDISQKFNNSFTLFLNNGKLFDILSLLLYSQYDLIHSFVKNDSFSLDNSFDLPYFISSLCFDLYSSIYSFCSYVCDSILLGVDYGNKNSALVDSSTSVLLSNLLVNDVETLLAPITNIIIGPSPTSTNQPQTSYCIYDLVITILKLLKDNSQIIRSFEKMKMSSQSDVLVNPHSFNSFYSLFLFPSISFILTLLNRTNSSSLLKRFLEGSIPSFSEISTNSNKLNDRPSSGKSEKLSRGNSDDYCGVSILSDCVHDLISLSLYTHCLSNQKTKDNYVFLYNFIISIPSITSFLLSETSSYSSSLLSLLSLISSPISSISTSHPSFVTPIDNSLVDSILIFAHIARISKDNYHYFLERSPSINSFVDILLPLLLYPSPSVKSKTCNLIGNLFKHDSSFYRFF
jgi:hypothetical protein